MNEVGADVEPNESRELDCPICGGESVCYTVHKDNWLTCARCRVRWWMGYGLFTVPFEGREYDEYTEKAIAALARIIHLDRPG